MIRDKETIFQRPRNRCPKIADQDLASSEFRTKFPVCYQLPLYSR